MSATHYFNMFPQKAWAGHADVSVLPDGQLCYTLHFYPFDSGNKRTVVVDPANVEHMRSVQQLRLRPVVRE